MRTGRVSALFAAAAIASLAVVGVAGPASAKSHKSNKKDHSSTTATSSPSSQLSALGNEVSAAKNRTFKATWTTSGSSGPSTVTLEQRPPQSLFTAGGGSGGGEVLATGKTTYFCSGASSGPKTCISAAGANPLASLVGLYTGSAFLSTVQGFAAEAEAKAAGVSLKFSSQSFSGLPARCVSVSAKGQSFKWCVTDSGILAYASQGGKTTFQLTSYSTKVSPSDFNLPAGATVQSIP